MRSKGSLVSLRVTRSLIADRFLKASFPGLSIFCVSCSAHGEDACREHEGYACTDEPRISQDTTQDAERTPGNQGGEDSTAQHSTRSSPPPRTASTGPVPEGCFSFFIARQ